MPKVPHPLPARPVLHLISQAHLDPVWLWPVRDGVAEALTTMQSAVDRAAETPTFTFTRSSACTYRWASESDPALFRSIKRLVKAGRWEIVGPWIEQPDCNLPSAEALLRQGLYGRAFFSRVFGAEGQSRIGYNVDSFGHAAGFPQILRQCGLDYYVFMRPGPAENPSLPLLFWWESPDGSRVLAQRIPIQYSQSYAATADTIEASVRASATEGFAPGFRHGLMFFGVGNHGGGPTREHVARIRKLQADPTFPAEIRFSSLHDYFACVEKDPAFKTLPVWRDELQYVFRGCYAATGETKRQHRTAEKALGVAESLAVIDRGAGADPSALREAWWRYGFNQFHDVLAGTCVTATHEETRDRFGATLTEANELALRSAAALARRVDTRSERGSVLFAANPLPWARTALVQLDTFSVPHGREQITHLETSDGRTIPIQWMRAEANYGPWGLPWGKLTAAVPLPPAGYAVFRVATTPLSSAWTNPLGETGVATEQFVKKDGDESRTLGQLEARPALSSLQLGAGGPEVLSAPLGFVVLRDNASTWGHGTDRFDDVVGRPESLGTRVLESGPLATVVREKARWHNSEIWLDVTRYAHTPVVELRVRVNWQERRHSLKLEIPTRLLPEAVFAKTCGGVTRRAVTGNEEPCHDWVAVSGRMGGAPATLALLNDSSYSYDIQGGALRMFLARGVAPAEHPPFEYRGDLENEIPFLDQGWQERRFWLLADSRPWDELALDRLAQEKQVSAIALLDSGHPGTEPWEKSEVSVGPENISVLALKAAEDGHGVVVRIQEMAGRATRVTGRFRGQRFTATLKPWQIRTLRLALTGKRLQVHPVTAMEHPL